MMPDEMPRAFKDASAEFIAIIEPVLRKKGHGSPLLHVLEGLAELRSLRMMPKWWHQVSSDARVASLLGIQLSGKDGWDRVESLRAYLDELTGQVVNRRSPLDWSMILRMFGHEFYKATPIASRILGAAITYTSDSPLPDRYLRCKTQRWLSGPAVLNDLDDLLSLVILCCNLDAVQRRIGKGQVLLLGPQFLPVQVGGDPEVDMSIQLYDGRRHISIGERAGAESGSAGMSYTSRDAQDIVMTWVDIRNHKLLSRRDETRLLEKHDPIVPFAASIRSLAPVHIFSESMTRETCAVVSILDAAWRWLVLRGANFARKRGTWTQYGYIECSHHWLVRDLTVNNRPIAGSHIELTAEEVFRILSPESLSVAYPLGRRVIIDLLSASRVLEGTVFRAEEGANANEWGSAFEAAVQGVVDTSPWRPPDWLRPLIGRVIRRNGLAVTDIDAIALTSGTLLLIDAKAFRLGPRLTRGEYSAVKSMAERVEQASIKWRGVVAQIRRNPELLGVPIPKDVRIDGLIVLPFIPYVAIGGAATERVLSLLRASSISELLLATMR